VEKITSLFDRFKKIMDSYQGAETDWKQKHEELNVLYWDIRYTEFKDSKHSSLCNYIKMKLEKDVSYERAKILISKLGGK
jgi:hypothetical protein